MNSTLPTRHRQINFELLRIVSMLMIVAMHTNFMSLGTPDQHYLIEHPTQSMLRVLIQSICIVSVNVFVMISGWFGIRASFKGLCKLLWQVAYFVGLLLLAQLFFEKDRISLMSLAMMFGLFEGGGWFVASYIGLYILSPVINNFLEKATNRQIILTTTVLFAFEFLYGNTGSAPFVCNGYSTFSFIGIYMLASLLHRLTIPCTATFWLTVSLICAMINCMLFLTFTYFDMTWTRKMVLNYINPLVIIGAVAIILLFNKLKIGGAKCMQLSSFSLRRLLPYIYSMKVHLIQSKYLKA